jgi:hypothetical protein
MNRLLSSESVMQREDLMWSKDAYQEQLIGYLHEVEIEIEQFAHSRIKQHDLRKLYIDLDTVTNRLWRLIGASDVEWESLRPPLEISCEQLQHDFYRIPHVDALTISVKVTDLPTKKLA